MTLVEDMAGCSTSGGLVDHATPDELERLMKGRIIRKTVLKCERAKPTRESRRQKRSKNVSKKDVACPHKVELLVFEERPGEVYAIETAPHCSHGTGGPRIENLQSSENRGQPEILILNILSTGQKRWRYCLMERLQRYGINSLKRIFADQGYSKQFLR